MEIALRHKRERQAIRDLGLDDAARVGVKAGLVDSVWSRTLGELSITTRQRKRPLRSALVEADGTETVVGSCIGRRGVGTSIVFGIAGFNGGFTVGAGTFGRANLGFHRQSKTE